MSIPVASIVTQCKFLLDVASSDRYTYGRDFGPGCNLALDAVTAVVASLLHDKKFSAEQLRELNVTQVFTASSFGRIHFPDLVKVWGVLGVYPECVFAGNLGGGILAPYESRFEREAAFVSSIYSAKQLTQEEWNEGADNVFLPGNTVMTGAQKRYAYFFASNYTATPAYVPGGEEMDIRPIPPTPKLVAVAYLKTPAKLVFTEADTDPPPGAVIELPDSMLPIIVQQVLRYISFQQGDGTNLYTVSTDELRKQLLAIA